MDETAEHNRLDEMVEAEVGKNQQAIQELSNDAYNDGQRIPADFEMETPETKNPQEDNERMEED